ncbi:MAG: hypothetical protein PUA83_00950 [Clostridiales bacterium]|nr:hypothetical protein [Clostridiales bacterium]
MRKPRVGLLPMYVELYDLTTPEIRPDIDAFHALVAEKLAGAGLEVLNVPVCRLESEFAAAVRKFERENADAIVTLHLAYSPSLESEKALAGTELPLIVMDTTPDYTYDQFTDVSKMMLNHGIHGVQDMCNLLVRNNKSFEICAGHLEHSDVAARVAESAKAAMIASGLRKARVGVVGGAFEGMGDFQLPEEEFERDLGISVVRYDEAAGEKRIAGVAQREIDAEYAEDEKFFEIAPSLTREVYDRTARTALAIRRWVEEEKLTAFTINFRATEGPNPALPVMPFTECSKAMVNGIGYAGEGDILTAALAGAVLSAVPDATFTEMFCPDWEHGSVYLSHMGEFNYRVADGRPLLQEKPFPFTNAENPTVAYKPLKGGRAVFMNLAPFGNGRYTMTLAPGEMLSISGENRMGTTVNGWFRPDVPLAEFLGRFSAVGATHHSVLVYGDCLNLLKTLAKFLCVRLETIV